MPENDLEVFKEKRFKIKTGKNKKTSLEQIYNKYGWLFLSFALLFLCFFMLYPILNSLYTSTFSSRGLLQRFVGVNNYLKLLTDQVFLQALQNNLLFLFIQVPIMLLLALIIATFLNDKSIKFRGVFRTGIFLPAVTSLVAAATVFRMMFNPNGIVNNSLMAIHVINQPIQWYTEPFWARVMLIVAMTWRWTGFNMIFLLSGLQNIPTELYEAAEIDGASRMDRFIHIIIPMLKPIILFTAITSTIGTLQLFDEPMNFAARGTTASTIGPGNSLLTMSIYIYNLCFMFMPNFGYAATVAWVIVFLVAVMSFIQFKLAGDQR
jgi:ABC-type sugar transport systems, permease components